jgi:hypothetical protein
MERAIAPTAATTLPESGKRVTALILVAAPVKALVLLVARCCARRRALAF